MFTRTQILKCSLRILLGVGVIWGLYFLRDHLILRAYPLVISVMTLLFFIRSLYRVPVCEKVARTIEGDLTPQGARYFRRLTHAWIIFLSVHVCITLSTLFLSHQFWALYNGCLSYILMGVMFFGEFIIRRWLRRD